MSTARNAIIKAKIENVITELMVKTDAANVYVDDTTTLATKLSSIIADIATKASTSDLTTGLAGKANASHTHAQSDITGLTDALALLASKTEVTSAIDALRQEMLGDTPVEAYNTFTELAAYIAAHKEVSDALTAAIGTKADKATTLTGYGITKLTLRSPTQFPLLPVVSLPLLSRLLLRLMRLVTMPVLMLLRPTLIRIAIRLFWTASLLTRLARGMQLKRKLRLMLMALTLLWILVLMLLRLIRTLILTRLC